MSERIESITDLLDRVGQINAANGWREGRATPTERLALIVTEVAEAIEEIRSGHDLVETYYPTKTADSDPGTVHKPEGVPSEIADIIIRCLDFAHAYEIDIEEAINEKLAYNQTRGYRHGGKVL